MWLYFGVTTVYFGGSDYMRAEQSLQQKGQLKGPRMYLAAGGVQGPVELLRDDIKLTAKYWPEGWSVRTPEEAKAAVDNASPRQRERRVPYPSWKVSRRNCSVPLPTRRIRTAWWSAAGRNSSA